MASPAQLVEIISRATGLPLPTIVDIDRRLVKGNLRTKGGRGFSAARMTALDAARLLTAVLASPQANASVDAVERYAQTRIDKARSTDLLYGADGLRDLAALPAKHGFVDALAALIGSTSTGSLANLISKSCDRWVPHIEVFAFTRATRGRIRVNGLPDDGAANVEYVAAPLGTHLSPKEQLALDSAARTVDRPGDLEQSRRVTERTILPIAKLIAEDQDD